MRLGTPKIPGPAGMEAAFRLDFLSSDEVRGQGVELLPTATPPTVDYGMALNGTTQYATVPLAQYTQAFQGGAPNQVSFMCEFFPDFNYDEAANRTLYDGAVAPNRYICYKDATPPNYPLYFYAGATTLVGTINAAAYGARWVVGGKNRIVAALQSGANEFFLNGASVGTSVTAWARTLPGGLMVGAALGPALYFDGRITDFRIYSRKLTVAEAIEMTTVP
jgi:hypothetical protein